MRCSALAEELDEPMIGSVEHRVRWLLVEDRSAWGHSAVIDVLGPDLAAAIKARRMLALLIRRREGDPASDAVRRAILVDTSVGAMAVRSVNDVAELAGLLDAPLTDFGAPLTDAIFLVCTNGKRDACCALRGRALMGALGANHAERVWECTHLGGHRFAGNLVCLPHGLIYGRVGAVDGPRLAGAYLAGHLEPLLMRGRSAWPAPAQVAEVALRTRLHLSGLADLTLVAADIAESDAAVTFATMAGETHRFELRAGLASPRRAISCRTDKVERPIHWTVVSSG